MDAVTLILFLLGIVVLVAGAEALVRGASRLAVSAGISPLVVGLTVVAFGTSSPELAVGVSAAARGDADLALGNVVGSNTFNVLFILGVSSLIASLVVAQRLVRIDVPVMIGVSALTLVLALDGAIGRLDGLLLAAGCVVYTAWTVVEGRRETSAAVIAEYEAELGPPEPSRRTPWYVDVGLVGLGLALLVVGSRWLVDGAVEIAGALGLSELVIGLTIVAAGTSLPEVATSVVATVRGERDIAVGNVVGSNVFNLLGVLGLSAIVAGDGLPVADSVVRFDLPVMLAVAVACLPIFFTGARISRWEGAVFLGYYAAYVSFLVLDASGHGAVEPMSAVMLAFVVPITVVTLVLVTVRERRRRRRRATSP